MKYNLYEYLTSTMTRFLTNFYQVPVCLMCWVSTFDPYQSSSLKVIIVSAWTVVKTQLKLKLTTKWRMKVESMRWKKNNALAIYLNKNTFHLLLLYPVVKHNHLLTTVSKILTCKRFFLFRTITIWNFLWLEPRYFIVTLYEMSLSSCRPAYDGRL